MAFYKGKYTAVQMAAHFKCSTKVVYKRLKEEGLQLGGNIPNEELDGEVQAVKQSHPKADSQVCLCSKRDFR